MKKVITVLLALVVVLSLVACAAANTVAPKANLDDTSKVTSTQSASESAPIETVGTKKLIALSQGESGNMWRTTNTNDMEKWAKASGYDFVWTDGNNDASTQMSQIQDLLTRKPDLLIIAPLQTDAISPAIDMVNEAKIPMITIDRVLNAEPGAGYYKAKIVQDFVEVGRLAAMRAVEMLTTKYGSPKGKILEITGTIGASPSVDQFNGIREIFAKYPDIEIVDSQPGNYDRAVARSVMDDYLIKYPEGSIDILITYCDDSALGSLQAMRNAGRTDLLGKIIAKDGLKDAIGEVIAGNIDVTYQCPPYFGEVTMDLIGKILNGDKFESTINVPFKTFDMRENKDLTQEYYKYLVDNKLDY